jgi:hypothetical protein
MRSEKLSVTKRNLKTITTVRLSLSKSFQTVYFNALRQARRDKTQSQNYYHRQTEPVEVLLKLFTSMRFDKLSVTRVFQL